MAYIRKLILLIMVFSLAACAAAKPTLYEKSMKDYEQTIADAKARLSVEPPALKLNGTAYINFSVLENRTFTLSANNVKLSTLLLAVCTDLGLDLIVEPDVILTSTMTVNFNKTPVSEALNIIMDMSDTFYELRGNVFIVKKYATKNFSIPHVPASTSYDSQVGGDVFGGQGDYGENLSSALKGGFNVGYKRLDGTNDFLGEIEKNIASMLGVTKDAQANMNADYYVINRSTGSIVIHSTRSKMKRVEDFFDDVFTKAKKQVLIEARIVDVLLSDTWSFGIEWSKITGSVTIKQMLGLSGLTSGSISIADPKKSFSAMINAVAEYGNTDTLANPRIMVMNGQSALISAGTITPFWESQTTQTATSGNPIVNTTYTRSNVLDGVLLGVTPFINDDGTITINIVPVSTTIQSTKSITDSQGIVVAEAPILSIKEAGTVVRVDDGSTIVMGGLITSSEGMKNKRIPFLGDIPILGYLFRSQEKTMNKRELVIFLRPTIVYSSGVPAK